MNRKIEDKTILDEFVENFCNVLEELNLKYFICSGFVAIAHGRSRGTEDIDLILEKLSEEKFFELHNSLIKNNFICLQSSDPKIIFLDYLKQGESARYVLESEGFFPPEMEIKFVKDELDEEQLNERQKLDFTGLNVYFSSIESNIAFKEELLCSEKDLEDAQHLRIIYQGKIDENKIKRLKEKIKRIRLNER